MASILEGASEADLKRMATLWLYSDMAATNWEAAHTAYDPEHKTQLASFKTVSNRTLSKYKKLVADGGAGPGSQGAEGEQAEKPKKAAPGKKRKPAAETGGDYKEDDGESPPKKPKATRKPRGKKGAAAAEVVTAEADEEAVNAEDDESGA